VLDGLAPGFRWGYEPERAVRLPEPLKPRA
jgi:hypothetical protein